MQTKTSSRPGTSKSHTPSAPHYCTRHNQRLATIRQTSSMSMKTTATIASFGGKLFKLSHEASSTKCTMSANLFMPPQASSSKKVPLLIYLAGLTCTGDNCTEKGFFQHAASTQGIAVLYPDTSPRMSGSPFASLKYTCYDQNLEEDYRS